MTVNRTEQTCLLTGSPLCSVTCLWRKKEGEKEKKGGGRKHSSAALGGSVFLLRVEAVEAVHSGQEEWAVWKHAGTEERRRKGKEGMAACFHMTHSFSKGSDHVGRKSM